MLMVHAPSAAQFQAWRGELSVVDDWSLYEYLIFPETEAGLTYLIDLHFQ